MIGSCIGWSPDRTATGQAEQIRALIMSAAPIMVFCPNCWGDGRIWFQPLYSTRYVPGTCTRCAGSGKVPA